MEDKELVAIFEEFYGKPLIDRLFELLGTIKLTEVVKTTEGGLHYICFATLAARLGIGQDLLSFDEFFELYLTENKIKGRGKLTFFLHSNTVKEFYDEYIYISDDYYKLRHDLMLKYVEKIHTRLETAEMIINNLNSKPAHTVGFFIANPYTLS